MERQFLLLSPFVFPCTDMTDTHLDMTPCATSCISFPSYLSTGLQLSLHNISLFICHILQCEISLWVKTQMRVTNEKPLKVTDNKEMERPPETHALKAVLESEVSRVSPPPWFGDFIPPANHYHQRRCLGYSGNPHSSVTDGTSLKAAARAAHVP